MKELIISPIYNDKGIVIGQEYHGELIRCRDCKYYTSKWCTKFSAKQFDINDICKDNNDFCSQAERKEG